MILIVIIFITLRTSTCIDILKLNCDGAKESLYKKCSGKSEWCIVKCDNEEETNEFHEELSISWINDTIYLKPGSDLDFVLQFMTIQLGSSTIIIVSLDENIFFSNDGIEEGRIKMKFKIRNNTISYIDLLGYSQDNEKVLIDTIRYKNSNTSLNVVIDKNVIVIDENENIIKIYEVDLKLNENKRSGGEELEVDSSLENRDFRKNNNSGDSKIVQSADWQLKKLNKISIGEKVKVEPKLEKEHLRNVKNSGMVKMHSADWTSNDIKRSIDEEVEADSRVDKDQNLREAKNSRKLGLWAITLISLGCVTITALVAVTAYHIGKIRTQEKGFPEIFVEEPPRVAIIPRVRGTDDRFEDTIQNYV